MNNTVKIELISSNCNKAEYTAKERKKWWIFSYLVKVKRQYYDVNIKAIQKDNYFQVGDVLLLSFESEFQQVKVDGIEDGVLDLYCSSEKPIFILNYHAVACLLYRSYPA